MPETIRSIHHGEKFPGYFDSRSRNELTFHPKSFILTFERVKNEKNRLSSNEMINWWGKQHHHRTELLSDTPCCFPRVFRINLNSPAVMVERNMPKSGAIIEVGPWRRRLRRTFRPKMGTIIWPKLAILPIFKIRSEQLHWFTFRHTKVATFLATTRTIVDKLGELHQITFWTAFYLFLLIWINWTSQRGN